MSGKKLLIKPFIEQSFYFRHAWLTSLNKQVNDMMLNWAKTSTLKLKYYDEPQSEVCEGSFTPVLLWQPDGLLPPRPTASCRRKEGGYEL